MPAGTPKRRGRPPAGGREAVLAATLELLRERGIGRLTTREVAQRAGVSEASIYYHYGDKAGLLQAVFEAGVTPLRELGERGPEGADPGKVMLSLGRALERFLDQALPVMAAAQSDIELRRRLSAFMESNDLGPHRGVAALGAYLAAEQAAGRVRGDADAEAVAALFVGACFVRASQRQLLGTGDTGFPSLQRVAAALDALLHP